MSSQCLQDVESHKMCPLWSEEWTTVKIIIQNVARLNQRMFSTVSILC